MIAAAEFSEIFMFALALLLAAALPFPQKPASIELDAAGYINARALGDVNQLQEVAMRSASKADIGRLIAAATLQASFRDGGAVKKAEECQQGSEHYKGKIQSVVLSVQCSNIIAADYFMKGQFASWARFESEAKANFERALWALTPEVKDVPIGSLDLLDYSQLTSWPESAVSPSAPIGSNRAKLVWQKVTSHGVESRETLPFVDVTFNGHHVLALVDTGTSFTMLPVPTASEVGVIPAARLKYGITGFDFTKSQWAGAGRVESLTVAGVTISNAFVVGTDTPVPILGLQDLQRLGHVIISRDYLTVVGNVDGSHTCAEPIFRALGPSGPLLGITMKAEVDGVLQLVTIDSGMADMYSRSAKDLSAVEGDRTTNKRSGVGDTEELQGLKSEHTIRLAGRSFTGKAFTYQDKVGRPSAVLGSRAIWMVGSLNLDFRRGRGCFESD